MIDRPMASMGHFADQPINQPAYPHPRPGPPIQLYLLAALATCGLAALWLAAFHAFLQVATGPQAFFAASLIEAGLIVESLALVRRGWLWYIVAAILVSLAVSGTYNYIQAAAAAPGMNSWQLGTLALGPLAALAFVALTLGHELREYQHRQAQWETSQAAWLEARRQEAEEYQRQQEAERQDRLYNLQQAEFERQEREREWQRRRIERQERRAERRERQPEPARAKPESLQCPQCGATAGKSGVPFRSQAALNAHQAHCPGSPAAQEPMVAANGTGAKS